MKRTFSFCNTILLLVGLLFVAGTTDAQKYSNEFLSIGVGARAQGMGNAVIAGIAATAARRLPFGECEQGRFMMQNGYERDCMQTTYDNEIVQVQ